MKAAYCPTWSLDMSESGREAAPDCRRGAFPAYRRVRVWTCAFGPLASTEGPDADPILSREGPLFPGLVGFIALFKFWERASWA